MDLLRPIGVADIIIYLQPKAKHGIPVLHVEIFPYLYQQTWADRSN